VTFSICVHETYETEDDDGETETHHRFGVAVTTRLAAVGTLCPFVSENGAVATQSLVNTRLGRKGIEYVDDGLAVEDALQSLLNADENSEARQLHGVDREGTFTFSGEDCQGWYGHSEGEGSEPSEANGEAVSSEHYTVAGNLLTGESVIEETAASYEDSDTEEPLTKRLIDALAAGFAEGGDKREKLPVHSATVLAARTEERELESFTDDLRVDATETPIEDLYETYQLAKQSFEDAMELYGDAYEEDSMEGVSEAEEWDDDGAKESADAAAE
jgi:uncharacterized Ntn-hydrolase superfamily protein